MQILARNLVLVRNPLNLTRNERYLKFSIDKTKEAEVTTDLSSVPKEVKKIETRLVQKGDLDKLLQEHIEKNRAIVDDLNKVLPLITDIDLHRMLSTKLVESVKMLKALEAGFVPVDDTWFISTELPKHGHKWRKDMLNKVLNTMPTEVKAAWERVKEMNIFTAFGVTPSRRGDPLLVGKIGRRYYLIAAWVNLFGGKESFAIGFIAHPRTS